MFSGLFVSRFGSRTTVITGSLLAAVGFLGTSFAPSIHVIIFTYGIVSGTAFGFMQMGAYFSINEYFDRRKGLALGVFTAGYSISPFVWPPLVTALFEYYGWRGTFMILAGIQLNMCVVGALMRPFPKVRSDDDHKTSQCSYLLTQSKVFRNKRFVAFCGTIFFVHSAYVYGYALKVAVHHIHHKEGTKMGGCGVTF
jgi:MFS family permease